MKEIKNLKNRGPNYNKNVIIIFGFIYQKND